MLISPTASWCVLRWMGHSIQHLRPMRHWVHMAFSANCSTGVCITHHEYTLPEKNRTLSCVCILVASAIGHFREGTFLGGHGSNPFQGTNKFCSLGYQGISQVRSDGKGLKRSPTNTLNRKVGSANVRITLE